MSRLSQLLPASWKGIPFLVRAEILTEGGRRIVLHEYPNSSERFVEDQGELPPKFSMTAFVTGADFIDRAEQLERALKEEGKGRLSMPTFGARQLFALPYRKDSSQKEVGEIKFELEFVAGKAVSGPARAPSTTETVYAQGDAARGELEIALDILWVPPIDTSNVLAAQFDLKQAVAAIKSITTVVDNIGDISTIGELINANSPSIVRSSETISSSLIGELWQTVSVGLSDGRGLSTLQNLTSFGSQLSLSLSDIKNATIPMSSSSDSDEVPLWPPTTAQRLERNKNRLSLVNAVRVSALVSAYEQAADTTYGTDEEIAETRLTLEQEHQRLMRVDTEDKTLIQSQVGVRRSVESIRLSALEVLDQKEQSAFSLTTIDTGVPTSAFVLTYDLYAEEFTTSGGLTDRAVVIRALSPTQPADKLNGDITVLQS